MKFSELLNIDNISDDFEVTGLCIDTRNIKENDIFFALPGSLENGENYIEIALQKGAKRVICEKKTENKRIYCVKNIFETYMKCVDKFYSFPQESVKLIGVTGTNGKTSVSHIISDILNNLRLNTGIIGTLGAKWQGKVLEFGNTTPSYLDFIKILRDMVDDGVKIVVCEVSAHAISQNRLGDTIFDIGIFTNLTQDHLDYFHTMEEYQKTKEYFLEKQCKYCIVNSDSEVGLNFYLNNQQKTLTYGIYNPSDAFGINFENSKLGEKFVSCVLDEIYNVDSVLLGEFNRYNLLCSVLTCRILGIKGKKLERAISKIRAIDGRFNVYKGEKTVIIDYAHTPDGMKNVLSTAKKMTSGNLVCVFGCGGDRDKSKRRIMGLIAESYADLVVLTEDNTRSENLPDIINDIMQDMTNTPKIIYSRREAIEYAINMANSSDIVLILGKGGEKYIEKGGYKYPFSDEEEVKRVLLHKE